MILISNISEIYREYTRTQRYPGYIQGIFGLYLESNLNIPKEALGRFTVYSGYIAYIPRICPEDIGGNVRCYCRCAAMSIIILNFAPLCSAIDHRGLRIATCGVFGHISPHRSYRHTVERDNLSIKASFVKSITEAKVQLGTRSTAAG